MRKINFKNVVWKEGRYYVAWNINTAISSFGDTKKEALNMLREALELYFEDMPTLKKPIIKKIFAASADLQLQHKLCNI
jgi:Uncharacterised protein family (UPF0150).